MFRVTHACFGVGVHGVATVAEGDGAERNRELIPDNRVVVHVRVAIILHSNAKHDEHRDGGGEDTDQTGKTDFLQRFEKNKRNANCSRADNRPDGVGKLRRGAGTQFIQILARQHYVKDRYTDERNGSEEECDPAADLAKGCSGDFLVRCQSCSPVIVQAPNENNAGVCVASSLEKKKREEGPFSLLKTYR